MSFLDAKQEMWVDFAQKGSRKDLLERLASDAEKAHQSNLNTQKESHEEVENLMMAGKAIQSIIERVSRSNIAQIESLVNDALDIIFHDQSIRFSVNSSEKRGTAAYTWTLTKDGIEGNINSFGGGVVAIPALVLKALSLVLSKRYPLLVLDESLSFVSAEYVPNVSDFLKQLSKQLGITVVLVTHQPKFSEAADLVYRFSTDKRKGASRVSLVADNRE